MGKLQNEQKVEEHLHSLKWHQDIVLEVYEDLIKECASEKKWDSNFNLVQFPDREKMPLHSYYLSTISYTFKDIFAEIYCTYKNRDILYDTLDKIKFATPEEYKRNFNLLRIDFLKALNLIDAFITCICDYNIDRSIFKFGFDTSRAREAFIWLMYTSNKPEMVDIQDMNRLKTFYKIQIERHKKRLNQYYDNTSIEAEYNEVWRSLERAGGQRQRVREFKIKALKLFKDSLQELINDVFNFYDHLSVYRDYLVETDKKDITDKDIYALQGAVMMAFATKRIFIERFSSYSKMPEMSLGHSELAGAQFTRSDISGSNFINSVFKYARLDNAVASNCDFSISDFSKCDAKGATLNNSTFNYSNMSGMDLSGATLKNSLLDAVIFRDNQLDGNLEYAYDLLGNNTEWTNMREMRERELDEADKKQSVLHPDDENNQIFTKLYTDLTKDSQDQTFWNMTCAKEDDVYPHILLANEAGEIIDETKTVFDEVLCEVQSRLSELVKECEAKVIGKDMLQILREAERIEEPNERAKRFAEYGSICFDSTTLRGANIIDSSLPQIDLSHIDMRNASFEKSDMSGCMGYYTEAQTAFFGGANLNGGEFYSSTFNDTNFTNANCINTLFINCGLHAVNMSKSLSVGITIVNTKREKPFLADLLMPVPSNDHRSDVFKHLSESIKDDEYLTKEDVDMADSNWNDAMAAKAKFIGLKMDRSYFSQTDLSNFMIFNCAVRWAAFDRADISYGLMLGTSFHQSIFRGATLAQAHIFASEFSGCRMTNLILIGARCDKVVFYDNDMSGANFSRGLFKNCVFRGCDFSKLNISKSVFVHCVFSDVDFKSCVGLNSAYFKECIFDHIAAFEKSQDASDPFNLDEDEIQSLNGNKAGDDVKVVRVGRTGSNNNLYSTSGERTNK